jgi:hypothetical protein
MSHEYPGINIDLRHYNNNGPIYPIGAHGNCFGADSKLLPVREVFMMVLMDRLSDKVDWHKKVFNEEIVSKWRKEALEQPEDKLFSQVVEATGGDTKVSMPRVHIISEAAFDYVCDLLVWGFKSLTSELVHQGVEGESCPFPAYGPDPDPRFRGQYDCQV